MPLAAAYFVFDIPLWIIAVGAAGVLLFSVALALMIRLALRKPGPHR